MKTSIEVASRKEADAIKAGLAQPATRAFVIIMGVLSELPSDRARKRVLEYVRDHFEEREKGLESVSALEIFDCEQGSDDWLRVRLGMPTASEFSTVLASGKGGGVSITRRTYLDKLAGERITGRPTATYTNRYMERGNAMEGEARDYYTMLTDSNPQRVGFIKNEKKGCSPDALIGNAGMLEIKTAEPHILVRVFDNDCVPTEHVPQLQGNLWVAEREWIDLIVYCPGMKAFISRVYRDESYIATIASAVDKFNDELDALTERVRARQ